MTLYKPSKLKIDKEVEKTVVLLGMHRNGTSLTSSILTNFGISMGENLTKSGKDNPRGFFEDEQFVRMNNKILLSLGGSWEFPPKHKKILALKKNKKIMNEIRSLVLAQQDKLWGWKDPTTTLTIDLYLPFLKNPYFIVCYRNAEAVAKSLTNKKNRFPMEENPMKVISIYNERLSNFLNKVDYPRLHVNYEDYFIDPRKQVTKIKNFLKLGKKANVEKAVSLIDNKLKHF